MNIAETWRANFGDVAPVGHRIRAAFPNRWIRIHSLPDSRRYAEDENDYSELLRRHNEVACEILGANSEAILFAHAWGTSEDFLRTLAEFEWTKRTGLMDAPLRTFPAVDDEDNGIVVGGCSIHWSPGAWDTLLRDVADWRAGSIVLCNPESGEVYAPYDGGVDVFVSNLQRVARLKERWSTWLSTHPDGL